MGLRHRFVLSYHGNTVPQEWGGPAHQNSRLLTHESVLLAEEFSVSFCPALWPLSVSIFLNNLYIKLLISFTVRRETEVSITSSFFPLDGNNHFCMFL